MAINTKMGLVAVPRRIKVDYIKAWTPQYHIWEWRSGGPILAQKRGMSLLQSSLVGIVR